jgi:hypothetical protein
LAVLYGVTTARLPVDFIFFELTRDEFHSLILHNATSKPGRGGRRKLPLVFTEHGAIMVATILNSQRAIEMSVYVVRAFVQLRELLTSNKELARGDVRVRRRAVQTPDSDRLLGVVREEPGRFPDFEVGGGGPGA